MIHSRFAAALAALPVPADPAEPFGAMEMRPLDMADAPVFADHLLRLGDRARRLRFGNAVHDGFLRHYAATHLGEGAAVTGLFVAGILRGVAETHRSAGTEAEAAFSLERPFRGLGLGARLLAGAMRDARARGVHRFVVHFMRENVAMARLARSAGARLRTEGSEVTALIDLAA